MVWLLHSLIFVTSIKIHSTLFIVLLFFFQADSEIAAKKKKLEELKAKKAAREQQQASAAASPKVGSEPASISSSFLEQASPDSILKDVNSILGPSVPKTPAKGSEGGSASPRKAFTGTLAAQNIAPINVVPEEKITLNMSAQTDESDNGLSLKFSNLFIFVYSNCAIFIVTLIFVGKWQNAKAKADTKDEDDDEQQFEERMRMRETELQKRVDTFLIEKQEFEEVGKMINWLK